MLVRYGAFFASPSSRNVSHSVNCERDWNNELQQNPSADAADARNVSRETFLLRVAHMDET